MAALNPRPAHRVAGVLACCAALLAACGSAAAKEWLVKPGEAIAAAIEKAAAGDTVKVERGYFSEHLVIAKSLVLRGVDRPTVSGGNAGDVIRVKAKDVVIDGLIVRDSGDDLTAQNAGIYVEPGSDRVAIRNSVLVYNLFGIWLEKVNDVEVRGNLITGKRDYPSAQRGNGIQLYDTNGAQVVGNSISYSRDGIYVDISHHARFVGNKIHHVRYGTHYMNSNHNVWENNESYLNRGGLALMEVRHQIVRNNRAWGNTDHGIMLRTIQDSVIENNVVAGNNRGFFIYDAEHNTLKGNLVIGNRVGAHVWAGSIRNDVDRNDFIQNQEQVRYVAQGDQAWGRESGNYWSNYLGWDADGDRVGDVKYEANDLVDRLTWRYPMARLLLNSPAVHTLRLIAQSFPILRSPSIVDAHPRMIPYHSDWSRWLDLQRH